jgi:nitrate/TMAO reductase-like tetraheme cytochrome c subunit
MIPPLLAGLLLLQQPQDTASLQRFREGIPSAPPPIPGGVAAMLRTIFNAPAWMWVAGGILFAGAAVVLVRLLWRRRLAIRDWLLARDRPLQLALAGCLGLVLGLAAWGGSVSWNYMQHENAFCLGCHIMEGPWNKFALDAGKHSKLKCHDCHKQGMYANARQLVLWIANRPEKIPPHAKVPSERCESCHATNQSEKWTRIKETAGHRTHLESDSTVLAKVQCVTCHGLAVHEFIPAKESCGQSGCHDKLEIKLGKMADQTTLHCSQCHQFTAEVPKLATRDSAAGTLRPASQQCLACHAMQRVLADFDADQDPHKGVCGTCHNPHTQATPQAAGATCASAGCHANWQRIPFHAGTAHRRVGERCLTCHEPHAARIDASDCVRCHARVTSRFGSLHLRPPLPFDTTRALRPTGRPEVRSENPAPEREGVPRRDLSPLRQPAGRPAGRESAGDLQGIILAASQPVPVLGQCSTCHEPARAEPGAAVQDSFPHSRHRRLPCLTCHATGTQHGRLTFEPPRGCQICHHQPSQQGNCPTCHTADQRARPRELSIGIAVRDSAPRVRTVSFAHSIHVELRCTQCHTESVTMAPSPAARGCRDCHENHHTARRSCENCHKGEQLQLAHRQDVSASHRACVACHTAATVAMLTPDRTFCLTCHPSRSDHYPSGQCSTCHFLKSPDELRPLLTETPPR